MAWFSNKKNKDEDKKTKDEKSENKDADLKSVSLPSGGDAEAYRIIVGPVVTEKAASGNSINKYVFRVLSDAGKTSIKSAIESLYGVSVIGVNTVKMPSKIRRIGKYEGTKSGFKKAVVTLKKGDSIAIQ